MATGWIVTLATKLGDLMKANAGLIAIVGSKAFPMGTVVNETRPYVTFALPLGDQSGHLLGSNEPYKEHVRFQVDGWTTTWTGAAQLMDAVFSCLDGAELTISGWGTCRIEGDGGTTIEDEIVDGVTAFRGRRRYKALLVRG
jgi:hypothetical protein